MGASLAAACGPDLATSGAQVSAGIQAPTEGRRNEWGINDLIVIDAIVALCEPRRMLTTADLFDIWEEIVASFGTGQRTRSLQAARALAYGHKAQLERLTRALGDLGYPEALRSPQALGSTLARFAGDHRQLPDGRSLRSWRSTALGSRAWYVHRGEAP